MNEIKLVLSLIFFLLGLSATAQTKEDKLVLLNGTVKEGKVAELTDNEIRFSHKGETLLYTFKKAEVHKIEFGSGRTEIITGKPVDETGSRLVSAENKVAVLPMPFISEGNATRMEQMQYRLQEMTLNYLQKSAREIRLQDAAETNALLRKKGITDYSLQQYTPKELATILGVEYVVTGNVTQLFGNMTTTTSGNTSGTKKVEPKGSRWEIKEKETTNGFSNTATNVQTDVAITIYNDKGEKIFSQSKHSILTTPEAYKNALHYLLKRTPLHKR